jgi:hypothetical protein
MVRIATAVSQKMTTATFCSVLLVEHDIRYTMASNLLFPLEHVFKRNNHLKVTCHDKFEAADIASSSGGLDIYAVYDIMPQKRWRCSKA